MKHFNVLLLLVCVLFSYNVYGQSGDGLNQEFVLYQYDRDTTGSEFESNINIPTGKKIQVNFDCCFSDSVDIYLNDSLYRSDYFVTDFSLSFAKALKLKLIEKQQILKVVLPNKKVYAEIILDRRFRILQVNRLEDQDEGLWQIIFSNNYPGYE